MKDNPLNNYARRMADYNLAHNPTAVEAIVIFRSVVRDHYQDVLLDGEVPPGRDVTNVVTECVKKRVAIKKQPSMKYVQFLDDPELLEDEKGLPWVVTFTLTDLPRAPRNDDRILLDGMYYTISFVEPVNRELDSIVSCIVYPEHSEPSEAFRLWDCVRLRPNDNVYSLIWSEGIPKFMSWDMHLEAVYHGTGEYRTIACYSNVTPATIDKSYFVWESNSKLPIGVSDSDTLMGAWEVIPTFANSPIQWKLGPQSFDATGFNSSGSPASKQRVQYPNSGYSVPIAFKLGRTTQPVAGTLQVKVPAGCSVLSFYALSWNDEQTCLRFYMGNEQLEFPLTPIPLDAGISGNPPYTIQDVSNVHLYEVQLPVQSVESVLTIKSGMQDPPELLSLDDEPDEEDESMLMALRSPKDSEDSYRIVLWGLHLR